ncbi:hypothetical protein Bca4012_093493 [Brassica carinata]
MYNMTFHVHMYIVSSGHVLQKLTNYGFLNLYSIQMNIFIAKHNCFSKSQIKKL